MLPCIDFQSGNRYIGYRYLLFKYNREVNR